MITLSLSGQPQGKGRARSFFRKKKGAAGITVSDFRIGSITPEKTRTYEGMIRTIAMDKMRGREIMQGPISLQLTAIFEVPKSWPKKKRALALAGCLLHTSKPDLDNVLKAWKDGMKGVIYRDNSQISRLKDVIKKYGEAPSVTVTVGEI